MTTTELTSAPTTSVSIYFLAAPQDEAICRTIQRHLAPVVRGSAIPVTLQSDFDIAPGVDVQTARAALLQADIVLSLISVDFIADDTVYDRFVKVLERYNAGQTRTVSILVRRVFLKGTPIDRLPLLPKNRSPLNDAKSWNSPDDAVSAVVEDLYASIQQLASLHLTVVPGSVISAPPTSGPDARAAVITPPPTAPSPQRFAPPAAPPGSPAAPPRAPGAPPATAAAPAPAPVAARPQPLPPPGTLPPPGAMPPPGARALGSATERPHHTVTVDWRKQYYKLLIGKRALALIIDYFVAIVVGMLFVWNDTMVGVAIIAAFYVGAPLCESSRMRGTPGKRLLGLQITHEDGSRISFGRAFSRNFARSLTFYAYIFVIPLVYQVTRFKKTKQLFHDEMSSTVISERR